MNRYPVAICVILWSSGLFALACGPGLIDDSAVVDTTGSFDRNQDSIGRLDASVEVDTDSSVPLCPGEIVRKCPDETGTFATPNLLVVSADWLAYPARFTHAARDVITGMFDIDGSAVPFVIQVKFVDLWSSSDFNHLANVMTLPVPESRDSEWIGVGYSPQGTFGTTTRQVAVFREANRYRIIDIPSDSDGAVLTGSNWPELETDLVLTGATYLAAKTTARHSSVHRLCLHGDALICFDGNEWVTEIDAEQVSAPIVSMAISQPNGAILIHALSENGDIFTHYNDQWITGNVNIDTTLTSASVNQEREILFAAGDGFIGRGDPRYAMLSCELDLDVLDFHFYQDNAEFILMSQRGDLFSGQFNFYTAPVVCGPLHHVDDAIDLFPVGPNLYVIAEDALYGTLDRAVNVE